MAPYLGYIGLERYLCSKSKLSDKQWCYLIRVIVNGQVEARPYLGELAVDEDGGCREEEVVQWAQRKYDQ